MKEFEEDGALGAERFREKSAMAMMPSWDEVVVDVVSTGTEKAFYVASPNVRLRPIRVGRLREAWAVANGEAILIAYHELADQVHLGLVDVEDIKFWRRSAIANVIDLTQGRAVPDRQVDWQAVHPLRLTQGADAVAHLPYGDDRTPLRGAALTQRNAT